MKGEFVRCYVHRTQVPRAGANSHHIVPKAAGGSDDPTNLTWLCATCHGVLHRCEEHLHAGRAGVVKDLVSSSFTSASQQRRMTVLVQEAAKAFAAADEAGIVGDGLIELPRVLFDKLRMLANETKDPRTGRRAGVQGYVERLLRGHLRKHGIELDDRGPKARTNPVKDGGLTPTPGFATVVAGEPFAPNPRRISGAMTMSNNEKTASIIDSLGTQGEKEELDEFADALPIVKAPTAPMRVIPPALAHLASVQLPAAPAQQPVAPPQVRVLPVVQPTVIARPVAASEPVTIAESVQAQFNAFAHSKRPKCGHCLWHEHSMHGHSRGPVPCNVLHEQPETELTEPIGSHSEPCDKFTQNTPWKQHVFRMLKTGTRDELVDAKKWMTSLLKNQEKVEAPVIEENDTVRFTVVEGGTGEIVDYEGKVIHARKGGSRIKVLCKPLRAGGDTIETILPIPADLPTLVVVQRYAEVREMGRTPKVSRVVATPEAIEKAQRNDALMQMKVTSAVSKLEDADEETGPDFDAICAELGVADEDEDRRARVTRAIGVLREHHIIGRKSGMYRLRGTMGPHAAKRIGEFAKEDRVTRWGKLMANAKTKADAANAEKAAPVAAKSRKSKKSSSE